MNKHYLKNEVSIYKVWIKITEIIKAIRKNHGVKIRLKLKKVNTYRLRLDIKATFNNNNKFKVFHKKNISVNKQSN